MPRHVFILFLAWIVPALVEVRADSWSGKSVDFSHGDLCVSPNGRFLQHTDGTPFLYLGDTAWELIYRLNEPEVELYMENRRAKGFTVIQTVILSELDGSDGINRPLINGSPSTPDPDYFKWVDRVLEIAGEKGLYVGLLPTWGDKVDKQWGAGPEYSTRRMLVSTADGSDVDMPTLPILYGLSAETVAERVRTLPFGKRWPRALRSVINGI